jgi:hypothetical protein
VASVGEGNSQSSKTGCFYSCVASDEKMEVVCGARERCREFGLTEPIAQYDVRELSDGERDVFGVHPYWCNNVTEDASHDDAVHGDELDIPEPGADGALPLSPNGRMWNGRPRAKLEVACGQIVALVFADGAAFQRIPHALNVGAGEAVLVVNAAHIEWMDKILWVFTEPGGERMSAIKLLQRQEEKLDGYDFAVVSINYERVVVDILWACKSSPDREGVRSLPPHIVDHAPRMCPCGLRECGTARVCSECVHTNHVERNMGRLGWHDLDPTTGLCKVFGCI